MQLFVLWWREISQFDSILHIPILTFIQMLNFSIVGNSRPTQMFVSNIFPYTFMVCIYLLWVIHYYVALWSMTVDCKRMWFYIGIKCLFETTALVNAQKVDSLTFHYNFVWLRFIYEKWIWAICITCSYHLIRLHNHKILWNRGYGK